MEEQNAEIKYGSQQGAVFRTRSISLQHRRRPRLPRSADDVCARSSLQRCDGWAYRSGASGRWGAFGCFRSFVRSRLSEEPSWQTNP